MFKDNLSFFLQEIVPKMNQSRNIKFHKLFKELPQDEICIKG